MKTIYLTKKNNDWEIIDKIRYSENNYPSFWRIKDALLFLRENYKNSNTKTIIQDNANDPQVSIAFKDDIELKFFENSNKPLNQSDKDEINSFFHDAKKNIDTNDQKKKPNKTVQTDVGQKNKTTVKDLSETKQNKKPKNTFVNFCLVFLCLSTLVVGIVMMTMGYL